MEDFFLKAAALMEEFYWLLFMFVLVMAANAAANVVRAINTSKDDRSKPDQKELPPPGPTSLLFKINWIE